MADDSVHDRTRLRAYELSVARGEHPGREEEDWVQAEREIFGGSGPATAGVGRNTTVLAGSDQRRWW